MNIHKINLHPYKESNSGKIIFFHFLSIVLKPHKNKDINLSIHSKHGQENMIRKELRIKESITLININVSKLCFNLYF